MYTDLLIRIFLVEHMSIYNYTYFVCLNNFTSSMHMRTRLLLVEVDLFNLNFFFFFKNSLTL